MIFTKSAILSLALATLAAAHPGHEEAEHRHAVKSRSAHLANKRALEGCAAKLAARGVTARNNERRMATLAKHRKARGIAEDGELCRSELSRLILEQFLLTRRNLPTLPTQRP